EPIFNDYIRRLYYVLYDRPEFDPLIALSFLVIGLITISIVDRFFKRRIPDIADNKLYPVLMVYFIYMVIRVAVLNDTSIKNGILIPPGGLMWNTFVLMFFAGAVVLEKKETLIKISFISVILGFLAAAWGIKQFHIGYMQGEQMWLDYLKAEGKFTTLFIAGVPRPFSTLKSPACFADFMLISIFSTLFLFTIKRVKIIWLLGILPMCYSILITSVRSNWFGFGAGLAFWFVFLRFKSPRGRLFAFIFICLVAVITNFTVDYFMERNQKLKQFSIVRLQQNTGNQEQKDLADIMIRSRATALHDPLGEYSMQHRLKLWGLVLRESVTRFQGILGFGMGTFDAHSYYFSILRCIGYPGLLLFLWLLYRTLKVGLQRFDSSEEFDDINIFRYLLTIIVLICVINLTGVHLSYHPADIYFWFFLGALVNCQWNREFLEQGSGGGSLGNDLLADQQS
ncbi:MAG: hypothetical protein ABIA63_08905, partial [bacterium]